METRRMKVHRVVLCVVDHDEVNDLQSLIENVNYPNDCIMPDVQRIDTVEVDWPEDDAHPLNYEATRGAEFERLFKDVIDRRLA